MTKIPGAIKEPIIDAMKSDRELAEDFIMGEINRKMGEEIRMGRLGGTVTDKFYSDN